jgi:hypothetical protein
VGAWRKLVKRCGKKPTRKRAHALRVVTLRIQAEVENKVVDLPHASHPAQAMLRFGKLAEKLRAALRSVINSVVVPNGESGAGGYSTRTTLFSSEYSEYHSAHSDR